VNTAAGKQTESAILKGYMREGGDTPSPQDIVRKLEQSLGFNPDAEPTWGYEEPDKQLFPEEAPTVEERKLALDCLGQLFYVVEERREPGMRRPGVSPQEMIAEIEQYLLQAQAEYKSAAPFPALTITHLLGATRRQIAWVKELKEFEETDDFNTALSVYRSIRNLLEQALHEEYPE
jgi:hypothetical protein